MSWRDLEGLYVLARKFQQAVDDPHGLSEALGYARELAHHTVCEIEDAADLECEFSVYEAELRDAPQTRRDARPLSDTAPGADAHGNVVVCRRADAALLMRDMPQGPFSVVRGYDFERACWEEEESFANLWEALESFDAETVCSVRWTREDLSRAVCERAGADVLSGLAEEERGRLLADMSGRIGEELEERCIEAGWETIASSPAIQDAADAARPAQTGRERRGDGRAARGPDTPQNTRPRAPSATPRPGGGRR